MEETILRKSEISRALGRLPMPNPTEEQLASPEFEVIWQAIKSWDVNVPECYGGYCGANGSHVAIILNALGKLSPSTTQKGTREEAMQELADQAQELGMGYEPPHPTTGDN